MFLSFLRFCFSHREFIKKVEQYKAQREKELLDIKRHAARRMQALIRGVLGRMKFKKNLPALKRAQKVRGICCECEANVAVRRCRQCKDKYCASCYDRIHAKGNISFCFLFTVAFYRLFALFDLLVYPPCNHDLTCSCSVMFFLKAPAVSMDGNTSNKTCELFPPPRAVAAA